MLYLKYIYINGLVLPLSADNTSLNFDNNDVLLRILLKSTSKKLQHIEMNNNLKFSLEALKEFLNNWKERNCSLYFKFVLRGSNKFSKKELYMYFFLKKKGQLINLN